MDKLIDGLLSILERLFPAGIPTWLLWIIGIPLLVYIILWLFEGIRKKSETSLIPLFYTEAKRQRVEDLCDLARRLQSHIYDLNSWEEWSDREYTEIEAEVEASGRLSAGWLPFNWGYREGIYREKTLSKALQKSKETLILLQGEPGSGKSVALRHLARVILERSLKMPSENILIPLYINLRELKRKRGQPVDSKLIENYIESTFHQFNDSAIDRFLFEDKAFEQGLQKKNWLFLFDSFDELPEVLNSQGALGVTGDYMAAITDFMRTRGKHCKAILASRPYRSPDKKNGWALFRILPLTEAYQRKLIRNARLGKPGVEKEIIGQLGNSRTEIRTIMSNPMLLRLLCEYMRDGTPFPQNLHQIFMMHIASYFEGEKGKLAEEKFGISTDDLRRFAEEVAFSMTAHSTEGLRPSRDNLRQAMKAQAFQIPHNFDEQLDALVYMRLARQEAVGTVEKRTFSFRHRRLQEYFATCAVLQNPNSVPPRDLLTCDLWRETAVTLLQTRNAEELTDIIEEAEKLLEQMAQDVRSRSQTKFEPPEHTLRRIWHDPETISWAVRKMLEIPKTSQQQGRTAFCWPENAQHVIGIFQDGLSRASWKLPSAIRISCETILMSAFRTGLPVDQKWALELAGVLSQRHLISMVTESLEGVGWLKEVGFRQSTRLRVLPEKVNKKIRESMLEDIRTGRYWGKALTLNTYVDRLPEPETPRVALRLFRLAPLLYFFLLSPVLVLLFLISLQPQESANYTTISNFLRWFIIFSVPILFFSGSWRLPWVKQHSRFSLHLLADVIGGVSFTVAIYFTMIFLIVIYSYHWDQPSDIRNLLLVSIYFFYAFAWSPSVIFCASEWEKPIRWWVWPIAPFLAAFLFFRSALRTLTHWGIRLGMRRAVKSGLIFMIFFLITYFISNLLAYAFLYIAIIIKETLFPQINEYIIYPLILGGILLIFLGITIFAYIKMRIWLRSIPDNLSGAQILQLSASQTPGWLYYLLMRVQSRQTLALTVDSLCIYEELSAYLHFTYEVAAQTGKTPLFYRGSDRRPPAGDVFQEWLYALEVKEPRGLLAISSNTQEPLNQIIERIRMDQARVQQIQRL